jgi:hypothetical protein
MSRTALVLALGFCVLGCGAARPSSAGERAGGGSSGAGGTNASGGSTAQPSNVGGSGGTETTAGGSANPSAGTAGVGGSGGSASHVVTACDDLPPPGEWQETTPAEVSAQFPEQEYGVIALAMDPLDPAVVYFGTHQIGIWKSTDCGASFIHVNTGTNGDVLDGGFQWSVAIDPVETNVLYANAGYSSSNGVFKSTNGGVDWAEFWPPAQQELRDIVDYNFTHKARIDPNDHEHVLVSFHAVCKAPYASACIGETTDAGTTWKIVDGDASWSGGEDQTVWFLTDSQTWLYSSQSNGLWRTSDGGSSWSVINAAWGGHNGGQLYRASDGTFYLSSPAGLLRSPDGLAWSTVEGVGTGMIGVTGDGTSLYASHGPYAEDPYLPYFTATESDGTSWTAFESPLLATGGYELAYDPDHHLLYSTNGTAGFWRVVLE